MKNPPPYADARTLENACAEALEAARRARASCREQPAGATFEEVLEAWDAIGRPLNRKEPISYGSNGMKRPRDSNVHNGSGLNRKEVGNEASRSANDRYHDSADGRTNRRWRSGDLFGLAPGRCPGRLGHV